jgi:arylsulfatase A-like enzyme
LFESFYVANPICSPLRASLLTGLYPYRRRTWKNNIPLDLEVPILIGMLEKEGYASAYYGK